MSFILMSHSTQELSFEMIQKNISKKCRGDTTWWENDYGEFSINFTIISNGSFEVGRLKKIEKK